MSDTPTKYIAPALEACGFALADVDLIRNTHGHHDHAGGNAELVAASGAKVWIRALSCRAAVQAPPARLGPGARAGGLATK